MAAWHGPPRDFICAGGYISPHQTSGCIIGPGLIDQWPRPEAPAVPVHTHYHFSPTAPAPRLSDEDIERIAKRVAELLKACAEVQ